MRPRLQPVLLLLIIPALFFSCAKQEYFKSESGIKNQLQGTWKLLPIPKFDAQQVEHIETWTFDDTKISIIQSSIVPNQSASSTYSVKTSISKAEVNIDNVYPPFQSPARVRSLNTTWQIVKLDDNILVIANDQQGTSGVTELDFQKIP